MIKAYFINPLKSAIIPEGHLPYVIKFGVYSGLIKRMNLTDSLQVFLGLWERETYKYIYKSLNLSGGGWMIDVGAGHGEMCVLFKLRGNHHPVIAVDPEEGTHERIVDIMQLNRCEGIDIVTDYIGARPNLPLDDFPVSGPGGFIKIDVDGGEVAVLRSGETLLRRDKPSLLIETHSAELENECLSFLTGLGYRCTIIKNAWWRFFIPEYRTIEHNRWLWAE